MYSDDEKVVLCGASAYEQKYYFNQDFSSLPQSVQDELHVMCVMFTVEIGGIFTLWFDGEGNLQFETEAVDADAMYDYIADVVSKSVGHGGFAFGSGNSIPDYVPTEEYLAMNSAIRRIRGDYGKA